MTSRDFCYWLQGFFEVQGLDNTVSISDGQAQLIRAHLNLVFNHEIDPDNFKNKTVDEIKVYDEIHKGARSVTEFEPTSKPTLPPPRMTPPDGPSDVIKPFISKSDGTPKAYFNDTFNPTGILEVRYNC